MRIDDLEARMRRGESFHSLRAPPAAFIVVRVDGRSFSKLTERLVEKPFDTVFHEWMVEAARGLLTTLGGLYAYSESDEISVLLPRDSDLFDRSVEKLVSVSAARAAATISLRCGEAVEFDGRIWLGARDEDVVDYFRWRQADAARCALNGWCYWLLRKSGLTAKQATAKLERASVSDKNELLHTNGVNYARVPAWQRRGVGIAWEQYAKQGVDPRTGATTTAKRRRVTVMDELPMKEAYADLLRRLVAPPSAG